MAYIYKITNQINGKTYISKIGNTIWECSSEVEQRPFKTWGEIS